MAKNYNAVNLPTTTTPGAVDGNLYWNNAIGRPRIRMGGTYQDVPGAKLVGIHYGSSGSAITIPHEGAGVNTQLDMTVAVEAGRLYRVEYQIYWYSGAGSTIFKTVRTYLSPTVSDMRGDVRTTNTVGWCTGSDNPGVNIASTYWTPDTSRNQQIRAWAWGRNSNDTNGPGALMTVTSHASICNSFVAVWDLGVS